MASDETTSFAVRWARKLPGRWARNGAVLGALLAFAPRATSQSLRLIFADPWTLAVFAISILAAAGMFALAGFLLGLCARRGLSPIDDANLSASVGSIPRKWATGVVILGVAVMLTDVIFQWRGQTFVPGGTPAAIAENVGYAAGVLGASAIIGLVAGYVSRRGLRKAIDDDRMRPGPVR